MEFTCRPATHQHLSVLRAMLILPRTVQADKCNDLLGSISNSELFKDSGSVLQVFNHEGKKPISIRIDPDTIEYFKKIAEETGIPYQNLMNHYLADCAAKGLRPSLVWQKKGA